MNNKKKIKNLKLNKQFHSKIATIDHNGFEAFLSKDFKNPVNKAGVLPPIALKLKNQKKEKKKNNLLVYAHELDLDSLSFP